MIVRFIFCLIPFNLIAMIGQKCLDIRVNGIAQITIGDSTFDSKDFLPIKNLPEKYKYDFQENENQTFFLKHGLIDSSNSLKYVDELFVTLDEGKRVKCINVFINSDAATIVKLFNQKLGHYQLNSTLNVPGLGDSNSYLWVTEMGICFRLSDSKKDFDTKESKLSVLIYNDETEYPGDFIIIEN